VQGDEAIGLQEPETDHGDERRAARDEPRLAVELAESVDRVGQGFGLEEAERMEAHAHRGLDATASTASMTLA